MRRLNLERALVRGQALRGRGKGRADELAVAASRRRPARDLDGMGPDLHEVLALLACEVNQGIEGELEARAHADEARGLVFHLAEPGELHRHQLVLRLGLAAAAHARADVAQVVQGRRVHLARFLQPADAGGQGAALLREERKREREREREKREGKGKEEKECAS